MAENGANTLPSHTETLIVGAGIVGCATAYHLTDMGRSDVTVVDQGSIPKTGGSTVHAPSGLMQTSPSKTMSELAQETRDLYSEVGGWEENGAIEIATTDERWDYLHHRMDQAQAWDVEGPELLTPSEVTDHVPILDAEKIHGGYHSPHDGRMDTVELLDGLRKAAEERGATFHELTTVTDIETNGGGVETVVTSEGRISVDDVVIAGNIWAPLLGDMVGVDIPLVPCAHQYAVTDSVPELDGWDHDVEQPWVRHQDQAMYFRQHGDGYGIGNYNHDPLLVTPDDIAAYDDAIQEEPVYDYVPGRGSRHEAFKQPSTRPFTDEHFEDAWAETKRLFPAFEDSDIVKGFNGMFAFTPDHMPILGEAPEVDGFWVAAGSWLTQAGGVGKVMAELMETGTPSTNIDAAHITRFQPHTASPSFVWDRGYESYAEVYDIHHPRGSFATHRNLRESPFARYQTSLDAEFYDMSGWERARWYGANEGLLDDYDVPDRSGWEAQLWSPIEGAEHQAVRDGVGMCDLTVFTTVDISGDDAAEFAQRVFTNDVDVPVGDAVYTLMCNEAGGIIGDVTVLRTAPDGFYVSANGGAAGTKQLAWLRSQVPTDFDVTVSDEVSSTCGVGVWGPDARDLLEPVVHADLGDDAFPYFSGQETYVGSVPATALRVSYVGELGWEFHAPMEYGAKLWNVLWEAGQDHDVVPMGDGALNTMRLEKGYRMYGVDMHSEYDPYEAGLGFAVDLDTEFVGRDALVAAAESEPSETLACITLDDETDVVLGGTPVYDGDSKVGYVTSAEYGYTVDRCIAYAYVPTAHADPGTSLDIQYENERYSGTVREEPLFDPDRERLQG